MNQRFSWHTKIHREKADLCEILLVLTCLFLLGYYTPLLVAFRCTFSFEFAHTRLQRCRAAPPVPRKKVQIHLEQLHNDFEHLQRKTPQNGLEFKQGRYSLSNFSHHLVFKIQKFQQNGVLSWTENHENGI